MSTFSDFISEPMARRALLACAMFGFANGFMSGFVVLRKSALKMGTLSHGLLPGIAVAVLFGVLTQWTGLAGAVLAAMFIGLGSIFVSRTSRLDQALGTAGTPGWRRRGGCDPPAARKTRRLPAPSRFARARSSIVPSLSSSTMGPSALRSWTI